MINFLSGKILFLEHQNITLFVNGIGYSIQVPDDRIYSLNSEVSLQIYYHFNQENGPQLFGFHSLAYKQVFIQIINCSGLGPKIGLAILSSMSPEEFLQAIALADVKSLSKVNGIGAKKAEMMIMQLKDKVNKISPSDQGTIAGATLIKIREISEALNSLNYSKFEVSSALDFIKKDSDFEVKPFDELLRRSLQHLSKIIKNA